MAINKINLPPVNDLEQWKDNVWQAFTELNNTEVAGTFTTVDGKTVSYNSVGRMINVE